MINCFLLLLLLPSSSSVSLNIHYYTKRREGSSISSSSEAAAKSLIMLPSPNNIIITILLLFLFALPPTISSSSFNLLPNQHHDPQSVVEEFQRRLNVSTTTRRRMLETSKDQVASTCSTGNPIDDCWKCDPNWAQNRQRLADCGIGFGHATTGGKGGRIYTVTDSSDHDTVNPTPGTLRHAVIQDEPLWIIFSGNMLIKLKHELIFNSQKTIDGRGAQVVITGGGCITIQYVSNVIIHGIQIRDCYPTGNTLIRSSPTHIGYRSKSDGDGVSIFSSNNIWIDHCTLSHCTDGLIDVIMGSTAITISNNYFSRHDEVMLLGHDDNYLPDSGMQVTIAFNRFGEGLVQRMPRCRRGYIHVVNNDFTEWKMYAIGGSGNPTINSQGNRYTAPSNDDAKEVTKRVETSDGAWADWNWRSDGDIMVNGAFFVESGQGMAAQYSKASSIDPKSATLIEHITINAGSFGGPRGDTSGASPLYSGHNNGGSSTGGNSNSGNNQDVFGLIIDGISGSGARRRMLLSPSPSSTTVFCIIMVTLSLTIITYFDDAASPLLLF
ncbi:probable pectate lyase 5 [Impatiens glandulifera]|uniref:probable pectate lyase 5 n=1 Tax=Impatiens glandulifera TaxID=253017 RepID=UPI001FB0A8E0|nr:probable pectate lyase 5 [Impatiens glandulifera]